MNILSIRRILSSLAVLAMFAASQHAAASGISFYQKASEARMPITGKVAMRLTIGAQGDVSNVRIVRSSGSPAIDSSAIAWLEQQVMKPVLVNGQAQEFSLVKEIKFSESGSRLK